MNYSNVGISILSLSTCSTKLLLVLTSQIGGDSSRKDRNNLQRMVVSMLQSLVLVKQQLYLWSSRQAESVARKNQNHVSQNKLNNRSTTVPCWSQARPYQRREPRHKRSHRSEAKQKTQAQASELVFFSFFIVFSFFHSFFFLFFAGARNPPLRQKELPNKQLTAQNFFFCDQGILQLFFFLCFFKDLTLADYNSVCEQMM